MEREGERYTSMTPIVKLEEQFLVLPAIPQPESTMFLSCIDHFSVHPMETILFYPFSESMPQFLLDVLRDSLSQILVPYHFMAGRFRSNGLEKRVEVHCNNAGIPFVSASSHLSLDELGDIRMPNPSFEQLVFPLDDGCKGDLYKSSLMAVQVTQFKCRGVSIGITMNHALMDGISAADFFHNYAALTRENKLNLFPDPDRTFFRARSPLGPKYEHRELMPLASAEIKSWIPVAELIFKTFIPPEEELCKYTFKAFNFRDSMIESLQKRCLADGGVTKCSRFEALAGHIWAAISRASAQGSSMIFVVDVRSKMQPPLAPGFCGNALVGAFATPPTLDEPHCLSHYVAKLQHAYQLVSSDEYVRSSLDYAELNYAIPAVSRGFMVSSWRRLGMFEADFGWGKAASHLPARMFPRYVLLLPSDTGTIAYLGLEHAAMEKFETLVSSS